MGMKNKRINLMGCGQVGKTLGRLWNDHQVVQIGQILNSSLSSAQLAVGFIGAGEAIADMEAMQPADIYLLGCPDNHLAACGDRLIASGLLCSGAVVFHCSGALSSALLAAAREQGAAVASMHPVKGFSSPERAIGSFAGTYCGLEGDEAALVVLRQLAEAIGGIPFGINPARKRLYHAASVLACNDLVALQELSIQTFAEAGIEREMAMRILQPIVQDAVHNVFAMGTVNALTGPVVRGDHQVVERQLADLQAWQPLAGEVYRLLGQLALQLARQRAKADVADLDRLAAILSDPADKA